MFNMFNMFMFMFMDWCHALPAAPVVRLLDCHIATLPHCHIATLPYCYIATLLHCHIATLLHCYIATLPHCHIAILPHFCIFVVLHFHIFLSAVRFLSDLVIIIRAIIRKNKGKSKKNNHFGQKIYQIGHFASAPAAPIGHFMLATCW